MYDLGEWIRKRYSKFCQNYHPRVVEILTEPSDRNLMSAECLLVGLFPFTGTRVKNGTFVFDKTRTWQPIPVHTMHSTMNLVSIVKYFRNYSATFNLPIYHFKASD